MSQTKARPGLHRSEVNKVIAGVCGGLGEYLDIDPTLIRVIFILLTVFGGSGILLYLILWLIIPLGKDTTGVSGGRFKEGTDRFRERAREVAQDIRIGGKGQNQADIWGWVILIFGIALLFNNFGFFTFFSLRDFWPVILIATGLLILYRKQ